MNQTAIAISSEPSRPFFNDALLVVAKEGVIPSDTLRKIQSQGVVVDVVDTVEGALQHAGQQHFTLAMVDSEVDGQQGMLLLERLRDASPEMPIIITTGAATVKHAVAAMQKGAADYLMKPVGSEVLETCLHHYINRRSSQSIPENDCHRGSDKPFLTASPTVETILETARAVAGSQATVLITGESGTGKEVLASYLHQSSGRGELPYVAINCAALPETLMESELFGYEKGAFTGAVSRKLGKFEQAGKGTLVLDEISEMPLTLQAKLLRVLQERRIDRIGGMGQVPFSAQVIAISNRDLVQLVRSGQMREDLYYRLNVIPLHLPSLRERPEDIPLLVEHFCRYYSGMYQRPALAIDGATLKALQGNVWQGNIRELENTIERAVLMGAWPSLEGSKTRLRDLPDNTDAPVVIRPGLSVKTVEEVLIKRTLHEVNDHREQAAKMLGISVRTLRNKLKEYKRRTEQLAKEATP